MTFQASVVRVFIASPSDTAKARRLLREAMDEWNSLHAEDTAVILLPVLWERDATPQMGDRPQGIINRDLVDAADVLLGIFWTRLGSPTSEAASGTVEEIERFIEAGKPVLIYFSDEPVRPDSVESEQYERLKDFRASLHDRGLYDTFSSPAELERKAGRALTKTVRTRFRSVMLTPEALDGAGLASPSGPRASLLAHTTREREIRGYSKSGRPQYTTRERLLIENQGTAAAEDFTFRFETDADSDAPPPSTWGNEDVVSKLPPGGSLEYPIALSMATAPQFDIVFSWTEDGTAYTDRQTLR